MSVDTDRCGMAGTRTMMYELLFALRNGASTAIRPSLPHPVDCRTQCVMESALAFRSTISSAKGSGGACTLAAATTCRMLSCAINSAIAPRGSPCTVARSADAGHYILQVMARFPARVFSDA